MLLYDEDKVFQWLYTKYGRDVASKLTGFLDFLTRISVIVLFYMVGVFFYSSSEGWTLDQSAFFITVTITTVGFGSYFYPSNETSQQFTIWYSIVGTILVVTQGVALTHRFVSQYQDSYLLRLDLPVYRRALYKTLFSLVVVVIVVFFTSATFAAMEDLPIDQAFYLTMTTAMTIGYGYPPIKSEATRRFCIFFILLCVMVWALAVSNVSEVLEELKNEKLRRLLVDGVLPASSGRSISSTKSPFNIGTDTPPEDGNDPFVSKRLSSQKSLQEKIFDTLVSVHSDEMLLYEMFKRPHVDFLTPNRLRSSALSPLSSETEMSESRDGVDQELPSQAEMEAALSERTLRRQAKLWAGMRAEEFVLDLLLKMGTVDKIKHIEPILEIYREVQSRGERTVSATIEL